MAQLGSRVLVVDDSRAIAELIEEILSGEGYRVTILNDGRADAVQATAAHVEPDCILLDGSLDGYGASWADAARLASHPRGVPVVMLSTQVSALTQVAESEGVQGHGPGVAALLPKPFDVEALVSAVGAAVGRTRPSGPGRDEV